MLLLGREKEAVEAYKRSLELNPENENAPGGAGKDKGQKMA